MNSIPKEELVRALQNLQANRCGYRRPFCDCKFGSARLKENLIGKPMFDGGEVNGCPELRLVALVVEYMTDREWNMVLKRAECSLPAMLRRGSTIGGKKRGGK
jgi:hypothetical protein